jgi:hypothetical protein
LQSALTSDYVYLHHILEYFLTCERGGKEVREKGRKKIKTGRRCRKGRKKVEVTIQKK